MPPSIALGICLTAVIGMLVLELRNAGGEAPVPWAPLVLFAVVASRPVAYWFEDDLLRGGERTDLDGNPVVRLFFLAVYGGAAWTLWRRGWHPVRFAMQNRALMAAYAYLAASCMWSEFPWVSFKRLLKDAGFLAVVAVLLVHPSPVASLRRMLVMIAMAYLPLSALTIKYYPSIGRSFTAAGEPMHVGLALHKNTLGMSVLILLAFLGWDLAVRRRERPVGGAGGCGGWRMGVRQGLVGMGLWLLWTSGCTTALVCGGLGLALHGGCGWAQRRGLAAGASLIPVAVVAAGIVGESVFGLSSSVLSLLGKDATLTGRTEIWALAGGQAMNPWLGHGYFCFWDTERAAEMMEDTIRYIKQAHNGYLEAHLDGGLIGVGFLGVFLVSQSLRCIRLLGGGGGEWARIRYVLWVVVLVYNLSESNFFRLGPLWFMTVFLAVEAAASDRVLGGRTAFPEVSTGKWAESYGILL